MFRKLKNKKGFAVLELAILTISLLALFLVSRFLFTNVDTNIDTTTEVDSISASLTTKQQPTNPTVSPSIPDINTSQTAQPLVAFIENDPVQEKLIIYDTNQKTRLSPLTELQNENPLEMGLGAWSPDGKLLPVAFIHDLENKNATEVFLYDASTHQAQRLYYADDPSHLERTASWRTGPVDKVRWPDDQNIPLDRNYFPDRTPPAQLTYLSLDGTLKEQSFSNYYLSNNRIKFDPEENNTEIKSFSVFGNDYQVNSPGKIIDVVSNQVITLHSENDQTSIYRTDIFIQEQDQINFNDGWVTLDGQLRPLHNELILMQQDDSTQPTKQRFTRVDMTKFTEQEVLFEYAIPGPPDFSTLALLNSSVNLGFFITGDGNWLVSYDLRINSPFHEDLVIRNIETREKIVLCEKKCSFNVSVYNPEQLLETYE